MASKNKHCNFCGAKHPKDEMIVYKDKLLCDELCKSMYIEAYESEEVKTVDKERVDSPVS